MSELDHLNEKIQKYAASQIPPGDRAWFVPVVGMTMEKSRKAAFLAIHKKVWDAPNRPIWSFFRFTIRPDVGNPHDENAMAVSIWIQDVKTGSWKEHQIGFIPAKDPQTKKECGYSRAFRLWFDQKQIRTTKYKVSPTSEETYESPLVRLVDVYYDSGSGFGKMFVAIHTDSELESIPRGVNPIPNWYRPIGAKSATKGRETAPIGISSAPAADIGDYPTPKQIALLEEAQRALAQAYRYQNDEGATTEATFLSQWDEEMAPVRSFASQADIQAFLKSFTGGGYTIPKIGGTDLASMAKEYGPVMAQNYYLLSGIYAGPFTRVHVSAVIAHVTEVVKLVQRFKSPVVG